MLIVYLISLIVFLIDLVSKYLALKYLKENISIIIIKNFFSLTLAKNTGVAFSMFDGYLFLIIIVTTLVILGIIWYLKHHGLNRIEKIGYALVMGGAIGNLIDRIRFSYVVDFLDFTIFGYDFPIFNIADSCIVIGIILIILLTPKEGGKRNEDNRRRKIEN